MKHAGHETVRVAADTTEARTVRGAASLERRRLRAVSSVLDEGHVGVVPHSEMCRDVMAGMAGERKGHVITRTGRKPGEPALGLPATTTTTGETSQRRGVAGPGKPWTADKRCPVLSEHVDYIDR